MLFPTSWAGTPAIGITLSDAEKERLKGSQPDAHHAVAWACAEVETPKWKIDQCHIHGETIYVVPRYKGYVPPTGDKLEQEYVALQNLLETHLIEKGLSDQ